MTVEVIVVCAIDENRCQGVDCSDKNTDCFLDRGVVVFGFKLCAMKKSERAFVWHFN